jgi:hypothetical protein
VLCFAGFIGVDVEGFGLGVGGWCGIPKKFWICSLCRGILASHVFSCFPCVGEAETGFCAGLAGYCCL